MLASVSGSSLHYEPANQSQARPHSSEPDSVASIPQVHMARAVFRSCQRFTRWPRCYLHATHYPQIHLTRFLLISGDVGLYFMFDLSDDLSLLLSSDLQYCRSVMAQQVFEAKAKMGQAATILYRVRDIRRAHLGDKCVEYAFSCHNTAELLARQCHADMRRQRWMRVVEEATAVDEGGGRWCAHSPCCPKHPL